jgi:hypothetical protein
MKIPMPISLDALECSPEASFALIEGECFLTTSDKRWNFDFWLPVALFQSKAKKLLLNAKVHSGRVELCLIADTGKVVSSVEIWPTDKPVSRTLYSGDNRKAKALMIRNKMPDTSKSMVEISGITLGNDTLDGN